MKYLLPILAAICLLSPASTPSKEAPVLQFLQSLNEAQLEQTNLPFDDLSRQNWHFFPGRMLFRPGILLEDLTSEQKDLAFNMLRHYLSESGYKKTKQIISLEEVLAEMEQNTDFRNPEVYYIAVYGNPEKDSLWAWSFEGHHVSLNFTIVEEQIAMSPRFLGAGPAIVPIGKRKGERTLAQEEDLGLELINSMTTAQRQQTIFQEASYWELVTATSTEVGPLDPVGIKFTDLQPKQQQILSKLIEAYISTMPEALAEQRLTALQQEDPAEIRFGWAGATEIGQPHYYRVQGQSFLIEFDNSQSNANHIHTVWRDFDGDFGRDLIREHYQKHHHHKK